MIVAADDECLVGSHKCNIEKSNCLNIDGSYICNCFLGYRMINSTCKDINECKDSANKCSTDSICKNTDGSYTCSCNDGTILQLGRNTRRLTIIKIGPKVFLKRMLMSAQILTSA